jgi:hypothetical protein
MVLQIKKKHKKNKSKVKNNKTKITYTVARLPPPPHQVTCFDGADVS